MPLRTIFKAVYPFEAIEIEIKIVFWGSRIDGKGEGNKKKENTLHVF